MAEKVLMYFMDGPEGKLWMQRNGKEPLIMRKTLMFFFASVAMANLLEHFSVLPSTLVVKNLAN